MAETNWAKVLTYLYERGRSVRYPVESAEIDEGMYGMYGHIPGDNPLRNATGLTEREALVALEFLSEQGLITIDEAAMEYDDSGYGQPTKYEVQFEQSGFRVAHERELAKRRDRTNTTLVGFTLALVLASLVAVLPSAWLFLGYELNLRLVGAFVLLEVVVWYILHTDLHEDLLDL